MQHDLFSSLDSFQAISVAASSSLLVRDVAGGYRAAEADEALASTWSMPRAGSESGN
ncbi:hypothetical protein [Hydrogenophaga sp. PAMC20947]|uniref:hypothetical protein n=1 Tax=Hydrogenophaga sp. PAMC20947 TaxID=2565558 RepID=UPI0014481682|nr:hypothetical protein [Hydrogenophaga sp. PAMC20947]